MILSGVEIERRLNKDIIIDPFNPKQINPNSYNLCLYHEMKRYVQDELDAKKNNPVEIINIPQEGFVLQPGELYLGRTVEYTATKNLVPMIVGRSSIGRLGILVHLTSGFGDIGFQGYWTLQITSIKKVRIYAGMKICQIYYHSIIGDNIDYTSGKYQNSREIISSKIYQEF